MSNIHRSQRLIPEDHPSLKGHFPGNPVVPGVVILEHIAHALASWQPGSIIAGFPVVKFHQVLKPGQPFGILLQQKEVGQFDFKCDVASQVIASGTFVTDNITAS